VGGGEPLAPRPAASTRAVAWAADLFVDGLCALAGFAADAPPRRWTVPPGSSGALLEVLVLCELGPEPDADALLALERDWMVPALEAWRSGALQSAALLAGNQAVRLQHTAFRGLWRAWRRRRPWWEELLQC